MSGLSQIGGGGNGTSSANMAAVSSDGAQYVQTAGLQKTVIAAATAGNTTIKASAGRLGRVVVVATGTNAMTFQDGGVTVAAIPANPAVGANFDFQMPMGTNIVALGNAANPGVTVVWS